MATSPEVEIANLLYRYSELLDDGRVDELADLFRGARIIMEPSSDGEMDADGVMDADALVRHFKKNLWWYPDGTLRATHVITNPIIEVDEESGTATCRSFYTVFQQTDTMPLQPIVSGRYYDRFERVNGEWRFAERDLRRFDLIGDRSQHIIGSGCGGIASQSEEQRQG